MVKSKKQTLLAVLSLTGFIILWMLITDAWDHSALLFPVQLLPIRKYLYGYLSRIIWMIPALILIRRFDKNLYWSRTQIFSKPKAEPVFAVFMVLTTVYALTLMVINYHAWHVTSENLLLLIIKFLIVGIAEETVFRGWGYNLLKKVHSNTVSLIVSALMFVVLHWPAYFIKLLLYGQFDWAGIITQSMSALFLGLLFAVMFRRSGTLWNPIIAHFYYDSMLKVFA